MNGEVVHRLGAVVWAVAGVLLALGAISARRQRQRELRRAAALLGRTADTGREPGSGTRGRAGGRGGRRPGNEPEGTPQTAKAEPGGPHAVRLRRRARTAVRRWAPVLGAIGTAHLLVGGALGIALGVLGGGAVWWWQRRPAPSEEFDTARAVRELPLAADLLAACIAAGSDPVTAARVVGESLGGPVGVRLAWGAAEIRLGGEPAEAWRRLARIPGAGPLARLLERAGDSGTPAAAPVARLAAEARAERGRVALEVARHAGVLITAPVGLCFLPAFITVGVLPVVIGLARGLLGGVLGR
ncbi:type II secretion system F family protein [Streptomyces sp. TS71-3]|uniref:type II secretion system F family protein n=1 Tax=Streptomyces sp. TS71-3 TaxID=2733862 RepID=UPI001B035F66|nr:type II secretion system F family protein [Streptomyces sp. TS71-3]GHJ34606.1 hypothetical protein Sm713_02150 [Streptomyces sp. TS71-3]